MPTQSLEGSDEHDVGAFSSRIGPLGVPLGLRPIYAENVAAFLDAGGADRARFFVYFAATQLARIAD
jgi:hypothetical protein